MSNERLPFSKVFAYALPALPMQTLLAPVAMMIPGLYVKNTETTLAAVGAIYLASRIFDGVTDPLIGYFSDRTKSRLGPRKPWLIVGTIIAVVAILFLFNPPSTADWRYLLVTLFSLYVGYTMLDVPHRSWGMELSHDYEERNRISTFVGILTVLGFFAFISLPLFPFFESSEFTLETFKWISIGVALVLPSTVLISLVYAPQGKELAVSESTFRGLFESLRKNKPFWTFGLAMVSAGMGWGAFIGLTFIVTDTYFKFGEYFAVISLVMFGFRMAFIPAWMKLANMMGKHKAWALSKLLEGLSFLGFLLLTPGETPVEMFFVVTICIGIFGGANEFIPMALLGDIVDYDTLKTGANKGGNYFAFYSLIQKVNYAVGGAFGFFILSIFNYDPKAEVNTPEAGAALIFTFAVVPAIFYAICALILLYYPLDARRHGIIRRRIESRSLRLQRVSADAEGVELSPANLAN